MPQRIPYTPQEKKLFYIHLVVYLVATLGIWILYKAEGARTGKWVYPWQAWITAAWGLAIIGHWCAVFRSYTDPGMTEYQRQQNN